MIYETFPNITEHSLIVNCISLNSKRSKSRIDLYEDFIFNVNLFSSSEISPIY